MSHSSSFTQNAFIPRSTFYESPFGRMFGHLPPWIAPGNSDTDRQSKLADLAASMIETPDAEFDNENLPAGYTYFGQFIDHDITFDPTSSLMRQNDPNRIRNFRTPRLDLDSVYGQGPEGSPHLYDRDIRGFFLNGERPFDLPRNQQGRALLGDPRNDENIIVSQLHVAFIRLHNRILERITGGASANDDQFHHAQTAVRWFYQYIVWNDFLKLLVNDKLHSKLLRFSPSEPVSYEGRFYKWKVAPYIPVEFSVAAYRFGHSMVRTAYQINDPHINFGVELPIFDPGARDLGGGKPLDPELVLQWDWFVSLPSSASPFPQASRKIDTKLAQGLTTLPIPAPPPMNSLPFRNLVRGIRMELPSGSAVAKAMGRSPITLDSEIQDSLWFYILKEAETLPGGNGGKMLGPVGGTITGEVFAGLLWGDPSSFIRLDPNWTPDAIIDLIQRDEENRQLPSQPGDWKLADLIRAAGMPEDAGDVPT